MKLTTIKKLGIPVFITLFALSVCGCTPSPYTDSHKKEITEAHKDDPQNWFDINLPGANVTSAEAYATGSDLFCALEGWYDYEKNSYRYIYDYDSNSMYTTQGYEAFQQKMESAVCKEAGLNSNHSVLVLSNWGFKTATTNDISEYEKYGASENGYANILADGYIPYTDNIDSYVEECLLGESNYRYYLYVYEDEPLDFNPDIFEKEANLLHITFFLKTDWNFDGISQVEYSKNEIKYQYAHIEEIENGFYAGFYTDLVAESEINSDYSDFEVLSSGPNDITLTIPENTKPLVFAPNGKKVYYLYGSDGKTEKDVFSKYKPEDLSDVYPGYSLYYRLVLPTSDFSAFTYYVKGKATFRLQVK